tara:strand:+ start:7001 stop:7492 length:492 start_codon:yes stop_codon:yes gene_type:complete
MKLGSLKFLSIILFFFININLQSQEKIDLPTLEPTFEEEIESSNTDEENTKVILKEKKRINNIKTNYVRFRALDKITAKISDIDIPIGKKKKFGYLEILPKKCSKSKDKNNDGFVVYIQVQDLSDKRDDKVFVFNGWTFSSSPTIKTFDHPVYDLWVIGCEKT